MVNIVTYSSLYPNAVNPVHGIFVERRLLELTRATDVTARVVAPVPWFPSRSRFFGKYADFAAIPRADHRNGVEVTYPRFALIPKVGMSLAPRMMAAGSAGTISQLIVDQGSVDLIDAHYFYPDGVAAAYLSQKFDIPFIVTARGSDINRIAKLKTPRKMILESARKASAVVAVSGALGKELSDLGVDASKIHVLPNGVDLKCFHPGDRSAARQKLGISGVTFLTVGMLIKEKGHDVAIRALEQMPGAKLIVIGAGPYEDDLRQLAKNLSLESRVQFAGRLEPRALLEYYQAADAVILASVREGMPNVVLESIACGTPVIATDVGGIPEVIGEPELGALLVDREPVSIARAWQKLNANGLCRESVRRAAERHSWNGTIARLHRLICQHSIVH